MRRTNDARKTLKTVVVSLKEMQLFCVQKRDGRRMTPKRSRYSYNRVVTPDHPATVPQMSEMEIGTMVS